MRGTSAEITVQCIHTLGVPLCTHQNRATFRHSCSQYITTLHTYSTNFVHHACPLSQNKQIKLASHTDWTHPGKCLRRTHCQSSYPVGTCHQLLAPWLVIRLSLHRIPYSTISVSVCDYEYTKHTGRLRVSYKSANCYESGRTPESWENYSTSVASSCLSSGRRNAAWVLPWSTIRTVHIYFARPEKVHDYSNKLLRLLHTF